MGITTFIIIGFIAYANAGFVWTSAGTGNNDNFPDFPNFPKLRFPAFPTFPKFPSIKTPSKDDIINNDNPNFSGMFVSSSSSSKIGPDGKVHKTGGTTIVTKDGGVVKEYNIGDNPENIGKQKVEDKKIAVLKQLTPPEIIIPQIQFWQPIIPLIPDQELLKAYKPIEKNQHFIGTSTSSFLHSSNVNGLRNDVGGTKIITNVDGVVSEKSSHIQTNDN